MKKLVLSLLGMAAFFLTGCLETTQEITLNEDGSGVISNTNDMSSLIGLAKQMGGGGDEMEKVSATKIDSTVSMQKGADSIPNLTPEEKEMVRKGTLHINIDIKSEKFLAGLSFPFSKPGEIETYNKLSGKVMAETMKDQLSGNMPLGDDQIPGFVSFDDYYKLEFSNGELTKKLDKEKYAGVESDPTFKTLKEASGMGLTMKANYIFNLPRPATKAEGKSVKLSEDKKKVTIAVDINDFFDDPSKLEFKIKY